MSKQQRLEWLAKLYSTDPADVDDSEANEHLFDRFNDFGMANFLTTFRPLSKLREAHGTLSFSLGQVQHTAPDLTYAELKFGEEVVFILRVRFEEEEPFRIRYWFSFPPLPDGVSIRDYQSSDAAGCVALEQACAMELADGSSWVVDRGVRFDEYLQLMGNLDAKVVVHNDTVIGFYSNALRPIQLNRESCYAVYQHHYRVHPDFRAASVSMALASEVDARRTFKDYSVVLPYSFVDPNNVHMAHVGFPVVPDIRVARLTIPLSHNGDTNLRRPKLAEIKTSLDATHGERLLYPGANTDHWLARLQRIDSYTEQQFVSNGAALMGLWTVGERNILTDQSGSIERTLALVLDYGFDNVDDLLALIRAVGPRLHAKGMTHVGLLMDTRVPEFAALEAIADDVQLLAMHTLPWMLDTFKSTPMYCDQIYV